MKKQEEQGNRTVEEIDGYLNQIPRFSRDKHTLDTLKQMLALLGDPQKGQRIIHVAGTNGKGSVCAFLSSILREAGASAAVFTSPHLLTVKERFSFDGRDVDDDLFFRAFTAVEDSLEVFEEQGLGHPSYFEYLFLMFMVMVKEHPVDYVVLETGLGGRLDATNVVESPLVTVITSISLDHMEYLGDTVEKIAAEKAGIIKAGVPVVYDNTCREASRVIEEKAAEMNSAAYPVDSSSYRELQLSGGHLRMKGTGLSGIGLDGTGLNAAGLNAAGEDGCGRYSSELQETVYDLDIPFAAEYQAVNSMLAVRAAQLLGISGQAVCEGIRRAVWPGRMEQIEPDIYLDGAHNEGGIREFAKAAGEIVKSRSGGRKILLFAVVSDKEYREMAEILCREFAPDVLVLTQIHYSRGLDIHELERAAGEAWERADRENKTPGAVTAHDVRVVATVEQAFEEVRREKRPEDTVFCAGSLYLIGEIKKVLRRNQNEQ